VLFFIIKFYIDKKSILLNYSSVETKTSTILSQGSSTEPTPLSEDLSPRISTLQISIALLILAAAIIGVVSHLNSSPPEPLPPLNAERKIISLDCRKNEVCVPSAEPDVRVIYTLPSECRGICSASLRPNFIIFNSQQCSWSN
jgi:hypothetical protein